MEEDTKNQNYMSEDSDELIVTEILTPTYFTVSVPKLILMTFCTLGLYQYFWFYMNWANIKETTEEKLSPGWRTLFTPLWAYSCFKTIKISAEEHEIEENLPIGLLGISFFILHLFYYAPAPYFLIGFFTIVPIIFVNRLALEVNTTLNSKFENNNKYSFLNWCALLLGGLIFIFGVIGSFASE